MEKLESYKEQINKVKSLIEKLEQGELSFTELTELEEATRALHERSIILKYKAFENSIKSTIEPAPVQVENIEEELEESSSPFDWNPVEESTDVVEENNDPVIELTEEEMNVETPPSIQDIMNDFTKEDVADVVEEVVIPEPEIEPEVETNTVQSEETASETEGTFIEQLNLADASTHSLSMGTKIDSLIGAFGLNEKLRFINDLFDGSSEAFNTAVKTLDSLSELSEANEKMNALAKDHSWEVEEETVGEFVSFVNRRYA